MVTSKIIVEFIPAPHWWMKSQWKLHKKYISANGQYVVNKGFISDGASIPRALIKVFSPTGRYFGAAILHDYILKHPPNGITMQSKHHWDIANTAFKAELEALNIAKWRIVILVSGVRVWGWSKTRIINKLKKV